MLFQLEIENFYSIGPREVVDLRSRSSLQDVAHLAPTYAASREHAPKIVGVFGPNGSGKTNFLKAIAFLAWFARDSFQLPPGQPLPFAPFQSRAWKEQPTRVAVEIGRGPLFSPWIAEKEVQGAGTSTHAPEMHHPGVYRYELEIACRGNSHFVTQERLFFRPNRARKRFRIFERTENGGIQASKFFSLRGLGAIAEKLRPNASIISTYAQFGHETALALQQALRGVFSNLLIYKEDLSLVQLANQFRQQPQLLKACNRDLQRLDLGLTNIGLASGPDPFHFHHEGLDAPIPWILESHGTQSFLRSFPYLWWTLESGGMALLDELDASIHPDILKEIFRWFRDPKKNPHSGQLFFSGQNSALLEDLHKEEIVLCEKNPQGFSRILPLADVKKVRRTENFFRGYRAGLYGALPNIG